MADAHASGACVRKGVEVQILSPAQVGGFHIRPQIDGLRWTNCQ